MKKLSIMIALGLFLAVGFSSVASAAYLDLYLEEVGGDWDHNVPGGLFDVDVFVDIADYDSSIGNMLFGVEFLDNGFDYLGYTARISEADGMWMSDYDRDNEFTDRSRAQFYTNYNSGVLGVGDDQLIATLHYRATGEVGTFDWDVVDLQESTADDDIKGFDGYIFDREDPLGSGNYVDMTWGAGTKTVVPVPAAAWLIGSAFLCLLGINKKKMS